MLAICSDCGTASEAAVGYCECGGIRIIERPIGDAEAQAGLWPASPLIRSRIPGLGNVYLKY